jgi:hypothetical protein
MLPGTRIDQIKMIMSFLTFVLVLFVIQFMMNTTSIELQSTQEVVRSDYDKLSSSTEANIQ